MKSENLNLWNPLGHSRPVTGLLYLYCTYTAIIYQLSNYDVTAENDVGPAVDIQERIVSYTYEN